MDGLVPSPTIFPDRCFVILDPVDYHSGPGRGRDSASLLPSAAIGPLVRSVEPPELHVHLEVVGEDCQASLTPAEI